MDVLKNITSKWWH